MPIVTVLLHPRAIVPHSDKNLSRYRIGVEFDMHYNFVHPS